MIIFAESHALTRSDSFHLFESNNVFKLSFGELDLQGAPVRRSLYDNFQRC